METGNESTPIQALADELAGRNGRTSLRGQVLTVANPAVPTLNDRISCDGDEFRWTWGQVIGPAIDVQFVADRIAYVLREVEA